MGLAGLHHVELEWGQPTSTFGFISVSVTICARKGNGRIVGTHHRCNTRTAVELSRGARRNFRLAHDVCASYTAGCTQRSSDQMVLPWNRRFHVSTHGRGCAEQNQLNFLSIAGYYTHLTSSTTLESLQAAPCPKLGNVPYKATVSPTNRAQHTWPRPQPATTGSVSCEGKAPLANPTSPRISHMTYTPSLYPSLRHSFRQK